MRSSTIPQVPSELLGIGAFTAFIMTSTMLRDRRTRD